MQTSNAEMKQKWSENDESITQSKFERQLRCSFLNLFENRLQDVVERYWRPHNSRWKTNVSETSSYGLNVDITYCEVLRRLQDVFTDVANTSCTNN